MSYKPRQLDMHPVSTKGLTLELEYVWNYHHGRTQTHTTQLDKYCPKHKKTSLAIS